MARMVTRLDCVLAHDVTVLIQGETGTGKELVARAVHDGSPRNNRPFAAVNTGAFSDALLESELFGHRRGAFSGAVEDHAGLFEAADGGTVFLDEIGEASPAMQVRLLRLLENGCLRRVGETRDRAVDVRVIAATHRDLETEVEAGRFRRDLYYRLEVFPVELPPLRERREDIPLLARHFATRHAERLGLVEPRLPLDVLDHLATRPWPGNVRELENVVLRMLLLSPRGDLRLPEEALGSKSEPLPERLPGPEALAAESQPPTLEDVERRYIREMLARTKGNLSQAARLLGLKRGTLRWRLKKLGLEG